MLDGLKVEHEKAREETDAEHQKQVDALKADHATLKADHAALKADHDALKAKKDAEHQKQVDALKADHAALKADHDALKAKKDAEHQKQVDALKADHATLKAAHAALKADHDALKDEHDALKGEHELDTLEAALEMKLKSLVAICDKTRGGISALHRSFLRWRTLASLTKLVPPLPPRSNASPTKLREKHAQELDDIKAKNDAAQMAMRLKQLVVVAGQQGCRAMLKLFWRWHNEASKAARKGLHRAAGRRPGFRGVVQASQSEAGALAQALMDIIVATTATHKQELEILQSTTATHKQELEILQSSSAKAHLSKCLKQLVLVSEHFQSIEVLRLFWKWRGVIYTTKHVEQHWDEADAHLTALLTETSAEKEQIREELTKVNAAAEAQYKQELEMYHFTNDQAKMTKCLKLLTFVSEHGGRQAVLRLFWIWHGKTLTAKHVDHHLSKADEEAQALIAKNAAEQEAMREELMQINAAAEVEHKQEVEKLQASRAEAHLSKCLKQIVLLSEHRGRQAVLRLFWIWHGKTLTAKHVDHHLSKADEEAQSLIMHHTAEQEAIREELTKINAAAEVQYKQEVSELQSSSAEAHLSKCLKQIVLLSEHRGRQAVLRLFWIWHGKTLTVKHVDHHLNKADEEAQSLIMHHAAEQEAMREELTKINAAAEAKRKQDERQETDIRTLFVLSKGLKQLVLVAEHRSRLAMMCLFFKWHGKTSTVKHVDHRLSKADEEAQALIAKNAAEQKAMREALTKINVAAEAEHKQEVEKLRSSAAEQEAKCEELTKIKAAAEAEHKKELEKLQSIRNEAHLSKSLKQLVIVSQHRGRQAALRLFWRWHGHVSTAKHVDHHLSKADEEAQALIAKNAAEQEAMREELVQINAAAEVEHKQEVEKLQATSSARVHLSKCLKQIVLLSEHRGRQAILRLFWIWHGNVSTVKLMESHMAKTDAEAQALITKKYYEEAQALIAKNAAEQETMREALTKINSEANVKHKQEVEKLQASRAEAHLSKCLKQIVLLSEHRGRQAVLRLFWRWHGNILTAKHVDHHLNKADEEAQALIAKNAAEQKAMRERLTKIHTAAEAEHKQEVEKLRSSAAEQEAKREELTQIYAAAEAANQQELNRLQSSSAQAHLSKSLKQLVIVAEQQGRQIVQRQFWRWHGVVSTVRNVLHHQFKVGADAKKNSIGRAAIFLQLNFADLQGKLLLVQLGFWRWYCRAIQRTRAFLSAPIVPGESQALEQDQPFCFLPFVSPPPSSSQESAKDREVMEALMNANAALEERYREGTKELTAAHTELRIENSLRRVFTMRLEQIRRALHLKFSRWCTITSFAVASQGQQPLPPPVSTQQTTQRSKAQIEQGKVAADAAAAEEAMGPPKRRPLASPSRRASTPRAR